MAVDTSGQIKISSVFEACRLRHLHLAQVQVYVLQIHAGLPDRRSKVKKGIIR